MYLDKRKPSRHWANTSGNDLVGKLIWEGKNTMKEAFERLLAENSIESKINEQSIFDQLMTSKEAVRSLLLASGYLKAIWHEPYESVAARGGK